MPCGIVLLVLISAYPLFLCCTQRQEDDQKIKKTERWKLTLVPMADYCTMLPLTICSNRLRGLSIEWDQKVLCTLQEEGHPSTPTPTPALAPTPTPTPTRVCRSRSLPPPPTSEYDWWLTRQLLLTWKRRRPSSLRVCRNCVHTLPWSWCRSTQKEHKTHLHTHRHRHVHWCY